MWQRVIRKVRSGGGGRPELELEEGEVRVTRSQNIKGTIATRLFHVIYHVIKTALRFFTPKHHAQCARQFCQRQRRCESQPSSRFNEQRVQNELLTADSRPI